MYCLLKLKILLLCLSMKTHTCKILTAQDLTKLFATAIVEDADLVPFLAFQALAGLRQVEALNLVVDDLDFDNRCIVVRCDRTGRNRIINQIPDAVWGWLEYSHVQEKGFPWRPSSSFGRRLLRVFRKAGVMQPTKCLRYSFGCHLHAQLRDIGQISNVMGANISNVSGMWVPSDSEEAKSYFSVNPQSLQASLLVSR